MAEAGAAHIGELPRGARAYFARPWVLMALNSTRYEAGWREAWWAWVRTPSRRAATSNINAYVITRYGIVPGRIVSPGPAWKLTNP